MESARHSGLRAPVYGLLVVLIATFGCGTRVEQDSAAVSAPTAAESPATGDSVGATGSAASATEQPLAAPVGGAPASGPAGTPTSLKSTANPASSGGSARTNALTPSAPSDASRPVSPAGEKGGRPVDSSPQGAAPGAAVPAETASGTFSPLVVASVGTYSGPVGTVVVPMLQGAQLWVKWVNARGGLRGHPVKLLVYDDGGDTARHRAQVQEAVEQQHVVAFLMNGEVITGKPSSDYIAQKRVPVIGLDGGEQHAYSNPMYFPQVSLAEALAKTYVPMLAGQALPRGKKKLGTVICVEAQTCNEIDRIVAEAAPAAGLLHVSRARASIAQPDYTAECLAARNAGAEVLFMVLDQNSTGRLTTACARQSYRPTISLVGQGLAEPMKENPSLDGAISSTPLFPWFGRGTPGADEFQDVFRTQGKGIGAGPGPTFGWAAGKLLERAARSISEPPTSASILEGLWSIRDDDLGGLTYPLTFERDRPPKPASCWFNVTIRAGAWISPDGYRLHCV